MKVLLGQALDGVLKVAADQVGKNLEAIKGELMQGALGKLPPGVAQAFLADLGLGKTSSTQRGGSEPRGRGKKTDSRRSGGRGSSSSPPPPPPPRPAEGAAEDEVIIDLELQPDGSWR